MTKTRNFIFKFSIPSETFKISTLDISSSINKIIQSKWKIREDPSTITKKKKRSQLIFVVIIEHDEVSADSWFADPSGKRWGWFVRDHVPSAEARQRSTVSSPWRPVSGVLEQHATGTVHHLGNEHRRAGAEPAISLLILVLVVFAVEIAALRKKHVFFHRNNIFKVGEDANGGNVRNLFYQLKSLKCKILLSNNFLMRKGNDFILNLWGKKFLFQIIY